jgi:plastocyanin
LKGITENMVSQPIWIVIVIGVFFVGVGVSYAYFASTYDPMSMKFQNQELFDQMMSNNPKMSQHWMGSDMITPQQMMNDPEMMQQMHDMMMSNPQHMNQMMVPMMNTMMNDPQMQQQMLTHMMNNPEMMNYMMNNQDMMHMMGGNMMMGENMMNNQQFSDNQNDVNKKTGTDSQSTQVSIARGSASPGCEKTNECYLPYSVSINEHSSVTWTNNDIAVHTVTSGIPSDGYNGIFDSGLISPGTTFTNQFDEEGTFDYYCIAHPWMTGNVVVLE